MTQAHYRGETMPIELRMAKLEARLNELEDIEAIRRLLATYAFNADLGRVEAYLEGWSEDGIYDLTEDIQLTGRAAISKLVDDPTGVHKTRLENQSITQTR